MYYTTKKHTVEKIKIIPHQRVKRSIPPQRVEQSITPSRVDQIIKIPRLEGKAKLHKHNLPTQQQQNKLSLRSRLPNHQNQATQKSSRQTYLQSPSNSSYIQC